MGVSILARLGLEELLAQNDEDYIKTAMRLAGDADRLGSLRSALRERMQHSPLCDPGGFTRALEAEYLRLYEAARAKTAENKG